MAKATKNKKNNKEGRHVGLDFYDLLIEALKTTRERAGAGYRGLPGAFKMRRMAAIVFQLRVVAGAP